MVLGRIWMRLNIINCSRDSVQFFFSKFQQLVVVELETLDSKIYMERQKVTNSQSTPEEEG